MSAPGYYFQDMTFCNDCAYRCTAIGLLLALGQLPSDMDEAIAMMVLSQVENSMPLEAPVAINAPGRCENCGKDFAPFPAATGGDAA